MVGQDQTEAENRIEAFKNFGHDTDQRSKFGSIVVDMDEEMILDFCDNFGRIDNCIYIKQICHRNFEILLDIEIMSGEWRKAGCKDLHDILLGSVSQGTITRQPARQ